MKNADKFTLETYINDVKIVQPITVRQRNPPKT